MTKTDPASGLYDTLRAERDKVSSIGFRRKSPQQREEFCTKRIHQYQKNIKTKLASIERDETTLNIFIDFRERAVWDRDEEEVRNPERVEGFSAN